MAKLYATFGPESGARRGRFLRRLSEPDFRGRALVASLAIGPEQSPDWAYTEDFRTEVLDMTTRRISVGTSLPTSSVKTASLFWSTSRFARRRPVKRSV